MYIAELAYTEILSFFIASGHHKHKEAVKNIIFVQTPSDLYLTVMWFFCFSGVFSENGKITWVFFSHQFSAVYHDVKAESNVSA